MSLRTFFTGTGYNSELLTLKEFRAQYNVEINTQTLSDIKKDVVLDYKTTSVYELYQYLAKSEINNIVSLEEMNISSENKLLQDSINELTALGKISSQFEFTRNLNGEIIALNNMGKLIRDWEMAKKNIIPNLFKNDNERIGFMYGYEKGLPNTQQAVGNNWLYLLMLPEFYNFRHYIYPGNPSTTKKHVYRSSFLNGCPIEYYMDAISIEGKNDIVHLTLKSRISNILDIAERRRNNPDKIEKYAFSIEAQYEVNKLDGKVMKAHAAICEKNDVTTLQSTEILLTHFRLPEPVVANSTPSLNFEISSTKPKWSILD